MSKRKPNINAKGEIVGGEERYTPDVGEADGKVVVCRTCGDQMGCSPEREGYRTFACAMEKIKSKFASFECPNLNSNWHKQIISIRHYITKCPSMVLCRLMEAEVKVLLKSRKATKKTYGW